MPSWKNAAVFSPRTTNGTANIAAFTPIAAKRENLEQSEVTLSDYLTLFITTNGTYNSLG